MSELLEHLLQRIGEDGPLTVAEYMAEALGHAEHGYYMRGDPFGHDGDFTTAPEISQMFGELIGLWAAVVWQMNGAPNPVNLVELGPGRGTLMADALRAAGNLPGFGEAVRVHLVETSPALKDLQKVALVGLSPDQGPYWHDTFEEVPDGPLMVVANEFFDALPVRHFLRVGDKWCERMVDSNPDGDGLAFVLLPPSRIDPPLPPGLRHVPSGALVEVCPAGSDIAHAVSKRLVRFGGAALVIDYGHPESAPGETLQAVKAHEFHDPLTDPGTADLTAHVDFAALGHAVLEGGGVAYGPVTQGDFLKGLGIEARTDSLLQTATAEQAEDIRSACQRLTGEEGMGTLFKAIAITRPGAPPPPGFE